MKRKIYALFLLYIRKQHQCGMSWFQLKFLSNVIVNSVNIGILAITSPDLKRAKHD